MSVLRADQSSCCIAGLAHTERRPVSLVIPEPSACSWFITRPSPSPRHLVPAARPRWSLCSLSDSPTLLDSLVHLNPLATTVDCSLLPAPDTHLVVPIHHISEANQVKRRKASRRLVKRLQPGSVFKQPRNPSVPIAAQPELSRLSEAPPHLYAPSRHLASPDF